MWSLHADDPSSQSDLRFELRLQQFIELIRKGPSHKLEALAHAKKYLTSHRDQTLVQRAAGLMAFSFDMPFEPLQSLFSAERWHRLADLFVETHHHMYNIPSVPLLNTALSAGLSALKTPACHSKAHLQSDAVDSVTNGHTPMGGANPSTISTYNLTTPICPICSTELNTLALNVPYAHHSKSHVDHDPVVLPNGRIYGSDRLRRANEKLGTEKGRVRDPWDGSEWDETRMRKVFIS